MDNEDEGRIAVGIGNVHRRAVVDEEPRDIGISLLGGDEQRGAPKRICEIELGTRGTECINISLPDCSEKIIG